MNTEKLPHKPSELLPLALDAWYWFEDHGLLDDRIIYTAIKSQRREFLESLIWTQREFANVLATGVSAEPDKFGEET